MSIFVDNEKEPAYNSLHNFVLTTDYKISFSKTFSEIKINTKITYFMISNLK